MPDLYWLEQAVADVPPGDDWLSQNEAACQRNLRFVKRRTEWRLGRWTAKRAVAASLKMPEHAATLRAIEIRPAADGAPEVILANRPERVTISLSHRAGFAISVVSLSGAALGCDLELVEPRSEAFVVDYLTAEEQQLAARVSEGERSRLVALIWSGKESALKALREGLRLDTRSLGVSFPEPQESPDSGAWLRFCVLHRDQRLLHGWWQATADRLRTVVAEPSPDAPVRLDPLLKEPMTDRSLTLAAL